jgi:hypothetical protein
VIEQMPGKGYGGYVADVNDLLANRNESEKLK